MKGRFFVSGIDTGIGKSVATGRLARMFSECGFETVTQKLVQTGCNGISEDIIFHRKLMGISLLPEDEDFTTCRYVLSYPSSPHVAAAIDGVKIDDSAINADTQKLLEKYDTVLIEGAGGIAVPISEGFLTSDYLEKYSLPLIFVVSSRLGSLNHALLSLEFVGARRIPLSGIVYNVFPEERREIEESTLEYLTRYVSKKFPSAKIWKMNRERIWEI